MSGHLKKAWSLFLDKVLVAGRPKDAPLIVMGDVEGFFCLFMNTLLDFTLLITLGSTIGMSKHYIQEKMIPGAGLVCLLGNLFYAWEARVLMRKEQRHDVAAQPFGIATPSLIGYFTLVMSPLTQENKLSIDNAFDVSLQGCFITGILYLIGSVSAPYFVKYFPQAGHMGALATIGFSILAVPYSMEIFAKPLLAIVPCLLFLLLVTGKVELPFRIPYGLLVIFVGTVIGWVLRAIGNDEWPRNGSSDPFQYFYPLFRSSFLTFSWTHCFKLMTVIVPLAIVNIVSIIQCLAGSKDQAGDEFQVLPSFFVNGFLTTFGALFGSPIPTVIYIGQPTFKALGARAAYSALNGIVLYALCSFGAIGYILDYMPQDAIISILLYIGLDITVTAMTHVPRSHAVAVGVALLPGIAKMSSINFGSVLGAVNGYLTDFVKDRVFQGQCLVSGSNATISCNVTLSSDTIRVSAFDLVNYYHDTYFVSGINSLNEGYLLTSMLLGAVVASFIERNRLEGAIYFLMMTVCTWLGLIHGWKYGTNGDIESVTIGQDGRWIVSPSFVVVYGSFSVILFLTYLYNRYRERNSLESFNTKADDHATGNSNETNEKTPLLRSDSDFSIANASNCSIAIE